MDERIKKVAKSVAPCGFVCAMCIKTNECGKNCAGCGTNGEVCSILLCCKTRGISGCWECSDFPCCECTSFRSVRLRAFIRCAKEEGIEKLAEYLIRNSESGIKYHNGPNIFHGDYDKCGSEDEILELLRTGKIKTPNE